MKTVSIRGAGYPLLSLGLSLDDDECDVIGSARALGKFGQGRFDAVANAGRRSFDVPRHHFIKTGWPKLFATGTGSFRDAIGIDHHDIAQLKLRSSFAIVGVPLDSQRQSTGCELLHRSARMNYQRRIVARVQ